MQEAVAAAQDVRIEVVESPVGDGCPAMVFDSE